MASVSKSGIGIKVTKNDPKISYLMFVYDYTIFIKANKSPAQNINIILEIIVSFKILNKLS